MARLNVMSDEEKARARDLVLTVCPVKCAGEGPLALCGHRCVVVDTLLYLIGGFDGQGFNSDVYLLSIGSMQWRKLEGCGSPHSLALFGHACVALETDIYVVGGLLRIGQRPTRTREQHNPLSTVFQESVASNGTHIFNTVSRQWRKVECAGIVPPPCYFHAMCLVGRNIYVIGGCFFLGYKGATNDLFMFDTNTLVWSKPAVKGVPPSARFGHSATTINGKIFVFGGASDETINLASAANETTVRTYNNDVHILDLDKMEWTRVRCGGSVPLPRAFHSAIFLEQEQRLLIVAGESERGTSDFIILNIGNMKFKRPLFDAVFEHVMQSTVLVMGTLLLMGGVSKTKGILEDLFFINIVAIQTALQNDHTFKLVIVGDSEVGKSCLMTRFVEDKFSDVHLSTIGQDFQSITTLVEGKLVKLHIWDTAGQERFAQITQHYYRGADGAILVYDVTNHNSFLHMEKWIDAIEGANSGRSVTKLLVGNKSDLVDKRTVTAEEGQELGHLMNAPFIETSAKDSGNVDVVFLNLAKRLVRTRCRKSGVSSIRITGSDASENAQGGSSFSDCCG